MDPTLVRKWMDAGELPELHAVARESAQGRIFNPPLLESGSAWGAFFRGQMPDRTGLWDGASRFDTSLYDRRTVRPDEVPAPALWRNLADAGRRILLVDPPYELPRPELRGVQVLDWLTHVRTCNGWLRTHPGQLAGRIRRTWGENPWANLPHNCPTNLAAVDTADQVATYRNHLLQRIAWKTELALQMLDQEHPDFCCVVFHDAHDVGHMCWHVHDPSHERHDPETAARIGDPVLDVYNALDTAVGRIRQVTEGSNVVLVFSHGMEKQRTATRLLDRLLTAMTPIQGGAVKAAMHSSYSKYSKTYRAIVPGRLRRMLSTTKVLRRVYDREQQSIFKSRPFFELTPNHAVGGVRLNLIGRENHGIVNPGREAEDLLARLSEDLLQIRNAESDEPLIAELTRTDAVYEGPERRQLPDLLLRWNRNHPIRRVYSPRFGVVEDTIWRPRSGDHLPDGMFFATGPDISSSVSVDLKMTAFAPTLAALANVGYEQEPVHALLRPV